MAHPLTDTAVGARLAGHRGSCCTPPSCWHWVPAGCSTPSKCRTSAAPSPLSVGKQLVTERFFAARLADGSLPQPYHCAI